MLTQQQLDAHYKGIGGSMASSVLGLNPYQSNIEAYLLLTDPEYREKNRAELVNNIHIKIGNALESIVIEQARIEKGWDIDCTNDTLYDKEYPFLIGHIDGERKKEREIIEVKVRGSFAVRNNYGDEGTDQVSDADFVQCQQYMELKDYDRAQLLCLDLGTKVINYYTIERDKSFIAAVKPLLVDFWKNNIEKLIPPTPITYEEASRLWRVSKSEIAVGTPEILHIAKMAKKAGALGRKIEAREKELKLEIAKFLQSRDTLVNEDLKEVLTYKTQTANRIDVDLFRNEQPILSQKYTKSSTSRVMRFKK